MPKNLTQKQRNFLKTYHLTGNGTQSYLKYYKCSTVSAGVSASKLLKTVKAKEYLKSLEEKAKKSVTEKYVASANDILHEDTLLALHRIPGAFDDNGNLKDMKDWPEALQASIKSIEYETATITRLPDDNGPPVMEAVRVIKKIHFHDKGAALGRMEKALGLVKDGETNVNVGELNVNFVKAILVKIDGQNRGKLPQDCD